MATTQAPPRARKAKPAEQKPDVPFVNGYGQVVNVIKAQGPWHGFNPVAGQGHKFALAAHVVDKLTITHFRMWFWIFDHSNANGSADTTEEFGGRSPYAVRRTKNGTVEAHLEHMAADLDIHIANLRRYWEQGVKAGIWRNGDPEKRESARAMYLCVEVQKAPEIGPETLNQKVCTYSWEKIPAYARKHLQALPEDQQAEFWEEFEITEVVDDILRPATVASERGAIGQVQDNLFRRFGTEKKRQEHEQNGVDPEYLKARNGIVAELQTHLEKYVHTLVEYVRSHPELWTKSRTNSKTEPVSLLPSEPSERGDSAGGPTLDPSPSRQDPQGSNRGKTFKQEYEAEGVVSGPRKSQTQQNANGGGRMGPPRILTTEEKEGLEVLFSEVARMQEAFPHTDFSAELVSPSRKSDVIVLRRILDRVRPDNVVDFCHFVARKFKGIDRSAMGKLPGREPGSPNGPRSVAMIELWAGDYAAKLDQAVRPSAEQDQQSRRYERRSCLELLADPKESAEAKRWARERISILEKGDL